MLLLYGWLQSDGLINNLALKLLAAPGPKNRSRVAKTRTMD